MKKVILTTGGTGGHIYPALSVAKVLKDKNVDVLFVGTDIRMEKDIVPKAGYRFIGLHIKPPKSISTAWAYLKGIVRAIKIVKEEKPDAIIGFGNYISIPVVLAGLLLKKNVYLQEQNANLCGANRFFYRFAKKVFLAFEKTYDEMPLKFHNKIIVTGNPLRENIYNVDRVIEREKIKVEEDEKVLLITGGSLGAQSINGAIISNWDKFLEAKKVRIYWATGEKNYDEIVKKIDKVKIQDTIRPYFENMIEIMAAADLVICRAGASTISEVIELDKPAVVVPYGSKKVGQYYNAKLLEDVGAAYLFKDSQAQEAVEKALEIIGDEKELENMRVNMRNLKKEKPAETIVKNLDIWRA